MFHRSVVTWIVSVCTGLRLSQRKTLAELVLGAMRCRRVSLADIGRSMCSKALPKHRIKRVWRFLSNHRVDLVEGARALVAIAAKAAGHQLFVAVDWVDVRQYKVLRAAVPIRGRSVPLLFAAYPKWQLYRSQNAFEAAFFLLLKTILPGGSEAVILADRGFGRAELAKELQRLALSYVLRVSAKVSFSRESVVCRLDELPLRPGQKIDLGFGAYRKTRPVEQRVLIYWKKHQAEPWFLVTDLAWGWRKVVVAYGLRMMIEELFRDEKNLRYGWGLRQLQLGRAGRLERMLLVLAFAYLLLLLIGLHCQATLGSAHWASASSTQKPQASAFFVGRFMQDRMRFRLRQLFHLLAERLTQIAKENWG